MQRILKGYSDSISKAFDLLASNIANKLSGVHFLTGTDPIYAGLHHTPTTKDGRSYRDTCHACYPWHTVDRSLTIVLTRKVHPYVVIHELGHVLDFMLNFKHVAKPVNDYAGTNRMEAFAESFACQFYWLGAKAEDIYQSDKATQYFFGEVLPMWR